MVRSPGVASCRHPRPKATKRVGGTGALETAVAWERGLAAASSVAGCVDG